MKTGFSLVKTLITVPSEPKRPLEARTINVAGVGAYIPTYLERVQRLSIERILLFLTDASNPHPASPRAFSRRILFRECINLYLNDFDIDQRTPGPTHEAEI